MKTKNKIGDSVNQFLDKIKGLDEKNLYYLFTGVLFLFFVLDYFILMGPQIRTLTELVPKINVLHENIAHTNADFERIPQYREQIREIRDQVEKAQYKVKAKEEVPIILESLSVLANEYDIKIDQIMPRVEEMELILKNDDREYYSLPIYIEARSAYHDFGKFLNRIENKDIYMSMGNFTMSKITNTRENSLRLTLIAVVYEQIDSSSVVKEKE